MSDSERDRITQTAAPGELVDALNLVFGKQTYNRAVQAKGIVVEGRFLPSPGAATLSKAPHFQRAVRVTARFSNFAGIPTVSDTDGLANPSGLAVRFHLAEHVHTDIISHSTDGFPTRTGQEFLEFLRAAAASGPSQPSPTPVEAFLAGHPKALAFVQTPKLSPSSFARESYFGVTAMRFTNSDGVEPLWTLSSSAGLRE